MKILILSDSHEHSELIVKAVKLEKPDMLIHLGDLEDSRDYVEQMAGSPKVACVFVRGNCDYSSQGYLPSQAVFSLKGHKIYCTHGDRLNVKMGVDRLVYTAQDEGCDIAMYGHTHVPFDEFVEGSFGTPKVHVLNPGSIALPRLPYKPSYMVMNMKDDGAYEVELKNLT